MSNRYSLSRIPRVPLENRAYAFLIDYVTVWLITSLLGGDSLFLQLLIFALAWIGLRVVLVQTNQGQSLGRWALDLKVIDTRYRRVPNMVVLSKREAILGSLAFVAMIGLNINFQNVLSMTILVSPLLANCGMAIADETTNQAFHDRLAETLIVPTRRGFSLDLRLRRWLKEAQKAWRTKK